MRYVPLLITGMLLTGSCNSLWSKYQDMQCVENCNDPDPRKHLLYEQPVWQTLQMFMGEMLCFLPVLYAWLRKSPAQAVQLTEVQDELVKLKPLTGYSVLLLWLPAACDLTGTTLMNVGLLYTPVSIYQMTRGALVLFVGILSVLFLKRHLFVYQWLSLLTVMIGVSFVGLSGSLIKEAITGDLLNNPDVPKTTSVLVGVFFVLFAQIFTAAQFVIEEKIMARYSVPALVAVGYEGFFGAISIVLFMPILARYKDVSIFFDLPRGWAQFINTPSVFWSGIVIAFSISLFNFFGLSVTRHVSATARSLTDTCRTLVIWIVSLFLGWEVLKFPISLLQIAGFGLLVYGTFLFNDLVLPPKVLQIPALGYGVSADAPDHLEEGEALLEEDEGRG